MGSWVDSEGSWTGAGSGVDSEGSRIGTGSGVDSECSWAGAGSRVDPEGSKTEVGSGVDSEGSWTGAGSGLDSKGSWAGANYRADSWNGTTSVKTSAEALEIPAALSEISRGSAKLANSPKCLWNAWVSSSAMFTMTGNTGVASVVAEDCVVTSIVGEERILLGYGSNYKAVYTPEVSVRTQRMRRLELLSKVYWILV